MPTISAAESSSGASSTTVDSSKKDDVYVDGKWSSEVNAQIDANSLRGSDSLPATLTSEESVENQVSLEENGNCRVKPRAAVEDLSSLMDDEKAKEVDGALKLSPSQVVRAEASERIIRGNTTESDKELDRDVYRGLEKEKTNQKETSNSTSWGDERENYVERIESDEFEWLDVVGSGDIMKKILCPGLEKQRPDRGQVLTVNLKGYLDDNSLVEDLKDYSFTLGDAEVVQGLELALPLMEVKEIAQIMINSRFAFGAIGREPDIPPDATITYTVELVNVADEPEIESLSIDERMKIGSDKKERGNFWFSRGDYSQAVVSYRRSLEYLDDENHIFSDPAESLQKMLENRLKVYNNLALAQLKLEAFDAAMKSVDNVLRVQPQNVKALFRKGKIFASQGNVDDAIVYMKKALKLEPETKVIQMELARLTTRKTHENLSERELYRKMLGEQRHSMQKKKSKSRLRMWGSLLGGIGAVVVGVFAYRQYHVWKDDLINDYPSIEVMKERLQFVLQNVSAKLEQFDLPMKNIFRPTI